MSMFNQAACDGPVQAIVKNESLMLGLGLFDLVIKTAIVHLPGYQKVLLPAVASVPVLFLLHQPIVAP